MRQIFFILIIALFAITDSSSLYAQGKLTGYLQTRSSFFVRDSSIKAFGTRQYDDQFYSTETWVDLTYSTKSGFQFKGRYDLFLNTNIFDPLGSTSAQGLGRWSVQKKVQKLDITAGYIYDQIGTGAAFQAYEARLLGIDNALVGLRLKYDLTDNIEIKGFVGKQKNRLDDPYDSVIKGVSAEGFYYFDSSGVSIAPGIGIVNRTIDDETMQTIASNIASYTSVSNIFTPSFNNYAFSVYNTLSYKSLTLYTEGVYKTREAVDLPAPEAFDETGRRMFLNRDGSFLYASLGYAKKGLSVTLQGKRTENFQLRTSPLERLTRGLLNFVPPMARQNTYRLATRYNAATQELGELGFQGDISYRFNKQFSMSANYSFIDNLAEPREALYREVYVDATLKDRDRKWKLIAGLQLQTYNQVIYEEKRDIDYTYVETVMPFIDFLYKFNKKTALRTELQYMNTDEDFGSWAFGLMELTYTSKWAFTISNMMTLSPETYNKKVWTEQEIIDNNIDVSKILHFYTAEIVYNRKSNRFSFGRVRQVEGIVCTGGICRYEPAFNGYRLTVRSRF